MKFRTLLTLSFVVVGFAFHQIGWTHGRGGWHPHGHSSFGFYFGGPVYPFPYYRYPDPYYYPPAIISVPQTPPVYIERSQPYAPQYPAGYWYYCHNPEGYYPYIKECPGGWQQVEPTPPR
ncbi:hypothetical protein ACQE3E_16780 [Methylomonas sp. MED-D]|uniref:hypothetical protein n=1 Tax=unclassified Methylomonas TaxID=2608980 RepID=UPI0009F42A5C|nr:MULTISPECIES: hypothetical protein [unclassified Methylomonas]MDT4330986.1 hypothetical protein [Methylomonas sp. MV1]NJA07781.1 hypothetical protein [Methylococcaceae bacterium WWC4]WGS84862.1 hypothetical protein QC632_17635 [Methylomonas sp. UP202]